GQDAGNRLQSLRVDGGMARNAWFLRRQADLLGLPVLAVLDAEATALGAAYLAGLKAGYWKDFDALRKLSSEAARHEPRMSEEERQRRLTVWRRAVQAVIAFYTPQT